MGGSVKRDLRPSVHINLRSCLQYYRLVKQMVWFRIRGKEWVSGAGVGRRGWRWAATWVVREALWRSTHTRPRQSCKILHFYICWEGRVNSVPTCAELRAQSTMITNLVPTTHCSTLCVGVCPAEQYCGVAKVIGQRFARECCLWEGRGGLNNNPRESVLSRKVLYCITFV